MTDEELRELLMARIGGRRAELAAFLHEHRPRNRRRANITIVLTSLAALLTAGPAVGGESFTHAIQQAFGLGSDSYVWRTLCLCALLLSAGAALMTNIGKSQDDTEQISAVQAASAQLDGLLTLLQFGSVSTDDAVKLYQQYSVAVPFVESTVPPVHPAAVASSDGGLQEPPETQLAMRPPVPHRPTGRPKVPPVHPR